MKSFFPAYRDADCVTAGSIRKMRIGANWSVSSSAASPLIKVLSEMAGTTDTEKSSEAFRLWRILLESRVGVSKVT